MTVAYEEIYKGVPIQIHYDETLNPLADDESVATMSISTWNNAPYGYSKSDMDKSDEIWRLIGDDFVENKAAQIANFLNYEIPSKIDDNFIEMLRENFYSFKEKAAHECLKFALETNNIQHKHITVDGYSDSDRWQIIAVMDEKSIKDVPADQVETFLNASVETAKLCCLQKVYRYQIGNESVGCYIGPECFDDNNNPPQILIDLRKEVDYLLKNKNGDMKIIYDTKGEIICKGLKKARKIIDTTSNNAYIEKINQTDTGRG